ncbi:Hypothetical protein PBC10988_39330 [Planctomycetales bacterium 10988]|nr:Hypothetical protein PBC10988_39330 [Planctomycetales bacterium 10988]
MLNALKYGAMISFVSLFLLGTPSTTDAQVVNGYSVKTVVYSSGNTLAGVFMQVDNAGNWVESNSDGRHTFRETGRDEWSVYLLKSDGARIQLDLHTKNITITGYGNRPEVLYKVMKSFK